MGLVDEWSCGRGGHLVVCSAVRSRTREYLVDKQGCRGQFGCWGWWVRCLRMLPRLLLLLVLHREALLHVRRSLCPCILNALLHEHWVERKLCLIVRHLLELVGDGTSTHTASHVLLFLEAVGMHALIHLIVLRLWHARRHGGCSSWVGGSR